MSSELRAAVVGAGFIGTAHARATRQAGARLVGVAASTPERAKDAAIRLGALRGYASPAEAVGDPDVDVVHLCVPNHLHAPLAMAALAAGKHVVCEKPLAVDPATSDSLVDALAASGTVGTVPFVYRFHPLVREIRARVAAGRLGPVHLAHGTYLQDWLSHPGDTDWRVDPSLGGPSRVLADIGSHWFDLAEFVLGDPVERVSARVTTVYAHRQTEDAAVVQFETMRGALGTVVLSQVSPGRKNALTLELSGTTGTARFDQEHPGSIWIGQRHEATTVAADPAVLDADAARHVVAPPGHPQGYLDCVDRFVADTYAAIDGATPDGLPTFDDGRRAVHLTAAALQSAASGGAWVEVLP